MGKTLLLYRRGWNRPAFTVVLNGRQCEGAGSNFPKVEQVGPSRTGGETMSKSNGVQRV